MKGTDMLTKKILLAAALSSLFAVPAVAQSPSILPDIDDVYCISVVRDDYDYLSDPDALTEAILAGEVVITVVNGAEACATTSTPTPTEEPIDTGFDAYLEFSTHVLGVIDTYGSLTEDVADAADRGSIPGMRKAITKLESWAKKEARYLDNHQPEACYEEAYDAYEDWVKSVKRFTGTTKRGLATYNMSTLNRGLDQLYESNDLMEEATDAIDTVTCFD